LRKRVGDGSVASCVDGCTTESSLCPSGVRLCLRRLNVDIFTPYYFASYIMVPEVGYEPTRTSYIRQETMNEKHNKNCELGLYVNAPIGANNLSGLIKPRLRAIVL